MVRYLGFGKASDWGTEVSITDFIDINTENIGEDNQTIFDDGVGSRDAKTWSAGRFNAEGSFDFVARPDNIGQMLAYFLGADSSTTIASPTGCSSVKTHTITGADSLPIWTLGVGVDNPANIIERTYDTVKTDTITLSHDSEGRLMVNVGVKGRKIRIDKAMETPSFSSLNAFVFHMAQIKIAGSSNGDVENVTINGTNNLQFKPTANSRFPGEWKEGLRVIEGTFDISFENDNEYNRFLGNSTATDPENTLTAVDLEIVWTSYTEAESCGGGSAVYALSLDMPTSVYLTTNANINSRDRVIQNVSFRAAYNSTNASALTAKLDNVDAAAYV